MERGKIKPIQKRAKKSLTITIKEKTIQTYPEKKTRRKRRSGKTSVKFMCVCVYVPLLLCAYIVFSAKNQKQLHFIVWRNERKRIKHKDE